MENPIFLFLFLFIICCFLSYSCSWFVRNLRRYNEMRREFEERERRRLEQQNFDIYTIERDRGLNVPPAYTKYEMPPTYDDAVKLSQTESPVDVSSSSAANSAVANTAATSSTTQANPIQESRLI